jgi:hypothetical protein
MLQAGRNDPRANWRLATAQPRQGHGHPADCEKEKRGRPAKDGPVRVYPVELLLQGFRLECGLRVRTLRFGFFL